MPFIVPSLDLSLGAAWRRACSSGRLEAVRILIEEGKARVDAKDGMGGTPLYVAASTGQQAIAVYLLSKGADVEARCCFSNNLSAPSNPVKNIFMRGKDICTDHFFARVSSTDLPKARSF